MKDPNQLIGQVFNRLTVIGYSHSNGKNRFYTFKCECGVEKTLPISPVKFGSILSCGCYNAEHNQIIGDRTRTHGMSKTPTYRSWSHMKSRCNDPDNKYYGKQGITYTEEWERFEAFLDSVGIRPPGTTLDRFPDPDGNYEPTNVRWATPKQQRNNRRHK